MASKHEQNELSDMAVDESACDSEEAIRHAGKQMLGYFQSPISLKILGNCVRKFPVNQLLGMRYPMVLKGKQTQVVFFCSPQIEIKGPLRFRRDQRSPQKPGCSSEAFETRVGATVFVIDRVVESQGEYGRHRDVVLGCQTNLESVSVGVNQILEPTVRNRG